MRLTSSRLVLATSAAALILAACGGGGGDDDDDESSVSPLAISGTASDGAAIAGSPVSIKCATGSGTGTTGSDGRYAVNIESARAPCVVEVTDGATKLHSVVETGTSETATANVTPFTELITAQVAGGSTDDLFTDFDAAAQAKLTATNVAEARTDLAVALEGKVDLTGFDPITTAFVVGDANDQKLGSLTTALSEAQSTLSEFAAVLAANPGSSAAAQTALLPAAAGCKSLKTSPVQTISPFGFERVMVDATNLTTTRADNSVQPLVDTGDCTFTHPDGTTILVSSSSIGANRYPIGGGAFSLSFGFPEQEIPLSDLTGTWNYVFYGRDASNAMSPFSPAHGRFTIDAGGRQIAPGEDCIEFDLCAAGRTDGVFTVNPSGGFDYGIAGGPIEFRNFAYRAPSGTLMLFAYANSASQTGLLVATKQVREPLPEAGTVTVFNQFTIGNAGTAGALSSNELTVTAVNASGNGSFTRTFSDGHTQTVLLNTPRDGLRRREAGSSPNSGGTPVPFNAVVQLRPQDVGLSISVSTDPAQNFFSTAVETPTP